MSNTIREEMAELGISQTGLVRTLMAWGDGRSFDVILRWVQRAVSNDPEVGEHFKFVLRILRDHADRRELLRRQLELMDAGTIRFQQNLGQGMRDNTAEVAAITDQQMQELDRLLSECRPPRATAAA